MPRGRPKGHTNALIPGERYYTPVDMAKLPFKFWDIKVNGYIFEPCVGTGNVVQALRELGFKNQIITNDIDDKVTAVMHRDVSKQMIWEALSQSAIGSPDWVITNPPFSLASTIIEYAYYYAKSGVIFFLPITYTEPTLDKDYWLYKNPPAGQLVLPRTSFSGDGKYAARTCCWFIWDKNGNTYPIRIIPRAEVKNILNEKSIVLR